MVFTTSFGPLVIDISIFYDDLTSVCILGIDTDPFSIALATVSLFRMISS